MNKTRWVVLGLGCFACAAPNPDGVGEGTFGTATESSESSGSEETEEEGSGSSDTSPGYCGDGELGADEECDLGNENADGGACTSDCELAVCGDGLVELGAEDCDDGGESASCDVDCTVASCGDGLTNVSAGEACDDANEDNSDACVDGCVAASCGDGHLWVGDEACDGGLSCLAGCNLASSCKILLDDDDDREDGLYDIDPSGEGEVMEVYCDMSTDGGGWTRGMLAHAGDVSFCDTNERWEPILAITDDWENGGELMSKFFDSNTSSEYSLPLSAVKILPGPYGSISSMFEFSGGQWHIWQYGVSNVFSLATLVGPNYSNKVNWNYSNSIQSKANYCIGGDPNHHACIYDGSEHGVCGQINHNGVWHTSNVTQELFVRDPI